MTTATAKRRNKKTRPESIEPTVGSHVVAAALTLDRISTDFRVKLNPAEAIEWARAATTYNAMPDNAMTALVDSINSIMPRMHFNEGNPNNGKTFHEIHVGNTGSRFVEVRFYLGYIKDAEFDYDALSSALRQVGEDLNADSNFSDKGSHYFVHRYWWD